MAVDRGKSRFLDPLAVQHVRGFEMRARLIVEGFLTGMHRSPFHGFSAEFAEFKPFNPGDEPRNIDWKVYGKTNRLYTRRYEEETNLRGYLLLDTSSSMHYPEQGLSKLDYAAHLAGALAYLLVRQRDAVGLTLFDDEVRFQARPRARLSHLVPLFRELQTLLEQREPTGRATATPDILHQVAPRLGRRGLVMLFTDGWMHGRPVEELTAALQHLRHNQHEVVVYLVQDFQRERELDLGVHPLLLKDLETGADLKVQPENIQTAYRQAVNTYLDTLRRQCRALNIELVELDTRTSYAHGLKQYLIKRQRMLR